MSHKKTTVKLDATNRKIIETIRLLMDEGSLKLDKNNVLQWQN